VTTNPANMDGPEMEGAQYSTAIGRAPLIGDASGPRLKPTDPPTQQCDDVAV
jgi:hypothetical protein